MRKKLEAGDYLNANTFQADFDLMIKNCMTFNPVGRTVNVTVAALELRKFFYEGWANLPPLKVVVREHEDDEEEDYNDDRDCMFALSLHFKLISYRPPSMGTIAYLESQIETMKGNFPVLKNNTAKKKDKKKREKEKEKGVSHPVVSTSKANDKDRYSYGAARDAELVYYDINNASRWHGISSREVFANVIFAPFTYLTFSLLSRPKFETCVIHDHLG